MMRHVRRQDCMQACLVVFRSLAHTTSAGRASASLHMSRERFGGFAALQAAQQAGHLCWRR